MVRDPRSFCQPLEITLNRAMGYGKRAIASVPVVMLPALFVPRLLRAFAAVVAPVPPLATGTPEAMPEWNTR